MRHTHSAADTKRTSQDDYIFARIHLAQEKDWRLKGAEIAI